MKRVAICAMLALLFCCARKGPDKNGALVSEDRDVSGFSAIEMIGTGTLYLSQGKDEALRVEASEYIIGYVTSVVSGDTLHLEVHPEAGQLIGEIDYYVTSKNIREIKVDGAGSFISETPLKIEDLDVEISGSSSARFGVEGRKLEVEIAGAGDVSVEGKVQKQSIEINGAGKYDGSKLVSDEAAVEINGVGSVLLDVAKELEIEINGGGAVYYSGSPDVRQKIAGAGKVEAVKPKSTK